MDGTVYISLTDAARALCEKAAESLKTADSATISNIKINGIEVEADITSSIFTRHYAGGATVVPKDIAFAAINSAGQTMVECSTELSTGIPTVGGCGRHQDNP